MAQLTQSGLIIESLSSILEKKQDRAISRFDDILPQGETLTVDSGSVIGRILQISAETDYLHEEALQELYSSLNPNSATDKQLEKLVQLKDMKRKPASMGSASLVLYGDMNVTVGSGAVVASKSTGDQFAIDTSVTFTNKTCAGVEVELSNPELEGVFTLTYVLNNDLNSNLPVAIKYGAGLTREALARFIKTNVENSTQKLVVIITNDYNLQIKPRVDGLVGDFYVSGNAIITRSFIPVNATSLYNVGVQVVNSITTIQSSTYGWRGVNNLFASLPSREIESDDQLRNRFFTSTGSLATSHMTAMYTALNDVDGVTYVKIQENTMNQDAFDGRSAHGFSVIVYGGDDYDIAEAIEKTRPLGVPMDGNVTVNINNYYSHTSTIKFSRPIQVPVKIKTSLEIYENFPIGGVIEIKNAVIDFFNNLTFGEDVILSRLYIPIQVVGGVGIKGIQIAKRGEEYGSSNIEIMYNEIATISFDDIEI